MLDILIVEDEKPIRDWISYTISMISEDFKVVDTACNGKVGLELAKKLNPQVIVSDIKMPIMNGIDFIKEVKKIMPDIYIILLTNYAEFTYAKEAISCGVYEYLIKSEIRLKELKEVLEKIQNDINSNNINIEEKDTIEEDNSNKYSKSIIKSLKFIEDNYKNTITLTDISKHVYLSNEYFSRLFKEEVGENFSTYLTNYRINKAQELIKNTDMKIVEIAIEVGYQNPSYFSKTYKKCKGVSPDEDRF